MKERSSLVIIGAEGFIGGNLVEIWRKKNIEIVAPTEEELDITDKEAIDKFVSTSLADSIVLLAAWTDVDGAEKDPDKAKRVNTKGAGIVTEAAKKYNKFLIYISTDFVFPGNPEKPGPYSEDVKPDINSPDIGVYAKSKLGGENAIARVGGEYAIIRIAFPFGNYNSERDYLRKLIESVKKGYGLFTDQVITPTYIPDLAEAILIIVQNRYKGIFHVATHPPTSPYNLGKYFLEARGEHFNIKEGSVSDYLKNPNMAKRPIKGGLLSDETQRRLEIRFLNWKDAVNKTLNSIKN